MKRSAAISMQFLYVGGVLFNNGWDLRGEDVSSMKIANLRIITINGGTSSIKFALFEAGNTLRRIWGARSSCRTVPCW